MHAYDRSLPEWFSRIEQRQITLPRFQRFEEWCASDVSDLLTTVIRGLPAGATLILQVGDNEKFISRTMIDAPNRDNRVTEQLLDGQQRLTALWRSLNDKYQDRTYLVSLEGDLEDIYKKQPVVYGQARWIRNGLRYPIWVDDPKECWIRKFIPVSLLRPDDIAIEIRKWIALAVGDNQEKRDEFYDEINKLRERVKFFNLPYLALPVETTKEVALDVFIKMNTSLVKLTPYDVVVVLVEEETGKSLHEHVSALIEEIPSVVEYADPSELVLDVVALHQDRVPSQAGYKGIDYSRMVDEWDVIVKGIKWMVDFLEEESIFDAQRLPSYTVIPIIAALRHYYPDHPDLKGNTRILLRKYLWRAFLTNRYEQSSASHALQDYRGLRQMLEFPNNDVKLPIFRTDEYPLLTKESILNAKWPKRKDIIARGLLGLQIKYGAVDIADDRPAKPSSIRSKDHPREYHHLFPESILKEAGISDDQIYLCLNCALLTKQTNRIISSKDPITYMKERIDNSTLGEATLQRRLKTHLIPYNELAVGYDHMNGEEKHQKIKNDYNAFLIARAELLAKVAQSACEGIFPDLSEIMGASN